MRWDGLFADLEAQAAAMAVAERGAEIEDRTRYEAGRITLCGRLRPAVGAIVRLRCMGGSAVAGTLRRVHPEWLLVQEGAGREAIVATAAVLSVGGLSRLSAAPDSGSVVDGRLGLRYALRLVVRDRSSIRLQLTDGTVLDGTPDRVGADFVEVAVHAAGELRRRGEVSEVLAVPISAVVLLRRDG